MGNNEYCRNCERPVSIISHVYRLGAWVLVRLKRAAVYKVVPITYNISQNVTTVAKERERLPPPLD